ncbi:ABC transporter substrate-binding protein [Bacillus sp. B15-48]|uniref:ABC transporter substrate-binding protein n=1 Tax=Bacillus sp. B15-48 TaxID=1548601 RepID=UPI00193F3A14|nr:ABC transporter substrate-binding protein [Bacillus sp. B15-48]MBM4763255.1 ABC transporter substrate-binding protein [Bacillus sp. B15-48]
MKKMYTLLLALLFAIGLLVGCGGNAGEEANETPTNETEQNEEGQSTEQAEQDFPVTIIDALENEVVIESKPKRIVTLIPSITEIVFGIGLGDEVVGVSDNDTYPEEVAEKEKVGGMEFNVEKIISLEPNLVLAHASNANSAEIGLQQIRDAGITVLIVNDAQNFDDVYDSIIMVGTATGEKKKAEILVEELKTKINEIKTKAQEVAEEDRKTVLVEVSPAPELYTVGANTFMNEIIEIINAENIITEDGWPKIDSEAVIERNPDVIITTHGFYTENPVENVVNRDGWQDITAVKNEQVFDVDSDRVTRPGPRIAQGVEELAKVVYPELFN